MTEQLWCFDKHSDGRYASGRFGMLHIMQSLRDLVQRCSLHQPADYGRGAEIVRAYDRGLDLERELWACLQWMDTALAYLQEYTHPSLHWRISGGDLILRKREDDTPK